jgi:superfamily II DNA or RNA helicase
MNFITPRTPTPDLADRYARLSPDLKRVLQLKGLVFFPTSKTDFVHCIQRTGLRGPDGKVWNFRTVTVAVEALRRQDLLTEELACAIPLVHQVTVDAVASGDGEVLVDAVRRTFPTPVGGGYFAYQSANPEIVFRAFRLAIYINDGAQFAASRNLYDRMSGEKQVALVLAMMLSDSRLDLEWLGSRAPVIQVALIEAKFLAFTALGAPSPDLPAVIAHCRAQQGREGFAGVSGMLLTLDLLSGRLEEVRRAVAQLGEAVDDTRTALEGALAFLEGRNDAAIMHYREALKQRRKRLGRRKLFLDDEHGLFFLLALLHANDPALHADIQAGLDIVLDPASAPPGGFKAILAMLWLVQGLDAKARELLAELRAAVGDEPISAACVALAEYVVDPDLVRAREADLAERFDQLRDVLPLMARIHAEILARIADKPARYQAWLAETGQGIGIAFTQLIQTRAPWERALESLNALLGGGTTKPDADKVARKTRRLAWFLDPESRQIEVVEQSPKGRDGWSDGRPVALKRLHASDPKLDYLTEHDRKALRGIRKHLKTGWYNEEYYEFDAPRTIAALVGHSTVFDLRRRSQPLELVAYPVELLVIETNAGYRIALSHASSEPTVFLEAETPARYRVVEVTKSHLAVQAILGTHGLTVPKAARDQVIAMVRRDNPTLPIRAEIAEVAQVGIEGRAEPVVQLVPYGEGLKLTLLVRPFGADGPAYVAGLGGRSVLSSHAGAQVRANRDLPRELADRAALIEACPTLRDRLGHDSAAPDSAAPAALSGAAADLHELVVEDLDGCLELLLEFQAYRGPLAIEWPEGRKLRVAPVSPGKFKLRVGQDRDWFSVDGSVALDDDQVLEMRFLLDRLGQARGRFVPLGDGSFVALTRQLQAQLQHLAAVSEPHKAGRRVHALGAPVLDAVLADAGEVKVDAAWKRHVARIRAAEGWTPTLPPTLQAELRDYQVEGFVWLARLARWGAGACLADDMGLGKTVQAIAVMLDRAAEGPCLVVAPTSVCPNWEAEIARFAPTLTTHRFAAAADRAALIAGLGPRDVLVCSYGLLHQAAEPLAAKPWQMVVLDEAQAIKNAETKRAQASMTLQCGFRLALTGTPVENYLDELWSLFHFVNPGLLGSREGFQKRFAGPIERDRDATARQALRALIRPFLLRRTKAAVLSELPPRTEQTMTVEMAETERIFYEALRQRALESLAASDAPAGRRKIQILAEITRLRRACCNPALIDAAAGVPSGKLDAFMDLVEELLRNRHRALVFSQFTGHLGLVRAALDARGVAYEYLDGSTPSAERERRVAAFQSGSAPLFLISLRAGGTGLNLTAADYVVHLDPWWNPAVEDQASDRAHRIGQERPVTIYRLIMQDSIEERILRLHRDKRDLASDLLDGAEAAGRLSEEELLDLIRV